MNMGGGALRVIPKRLGTTDKVHLAYTPPPRHMSHILLKLALQACKIIIIMSSALPTFCRVGVWSGITYRRCKVSFRARWQRIFWLQFTMVGRGDTAPLILIYVNHLAWWHSTCLGCTLKQGHPVWISFICCFVLFFLLYTDKTKQAFNLKPQIGVLPCTWSEVF